MCSQGLARGKKAGVEEEKQEAAEATQGQRQPWGTLQKSFRHVVEKMRSEEMKVAHLSHGLQHLCRVAFASPVRHVAHHSPKRSFVVLDAESTLHFLREDGSLVRSVAAPAPMTGLLYAAQVDRFVGWDTEGLLVLDSSFQLLSQVPSRLPIRCGLYSEQLNRIVTAGEGNLTLWGFRYGFRSLQCHAAVSEGLEPSNVFTHLALGADSPESQSCFTACDTGAAAFDIAKGRLLSFKKDLHSRVITGLAYCHVTGCVVTASRDTTIKVWDKNWNIQTVFVGHTGADLTVKMWRLFPYAEECLVPLLCFSCNSPATHMCSLGETLAVAFQDPETITHRIVYYSLMEQTCYEHKPEDDAEDEITGLCCCPNLTLFASASRDGSVKVWDIKNKLLRHLKLNTIPESLAFANRWGDLLVGIERHLYLIHHNKYLPNYYRMKFLCTKFLEPLKDIPLPLSNSCFEALVKENVRRLLHEPPLEEAESPLPGAQRQETKAPPRDSQPLPRGLSGLAERDRDLLRLQTGRMSPAKKGRVTQEMKEEAFERYLRIFYKEQPKMEIPKEDPFDADEVLEALRHVDSVAKLYGPARPNMFLGCFPRPSVLKPAEQTPPEASPPAESSSRVPSLGRIPLAVTLEALVQFSRRKKDRKEEEAALLEKEQAPPLKGPILSPREASPSAQAPKPPLTPSVSPQAISAAGSREGRRKGRRKKKSDKGLGVVHEPDTAPAFPLSSYVSPAPGGVAEAIPHEKSISFKESPSVVQRQASHKRSSSPSSRPRSQTSVIVKGFFPERHPESPEWSRSQIRRALGSRQSVPLPGISSGYIPNSVVAQQLHVWDQPEEEEEEYRQERLVEVTGPQEELESLSGISSTGVMGSEESEESPAWEPSGAKPAGSSQSPVKESPPEVFLTQLDASQYPDKEQMPPSFILPLVDTEWFQKMFPEGFPPETTLQQFLAMLLGNIVTADFNTKTELLGAVLSLKEQLKDRMRQTVYKTLLHVLNMKEGSPSMQERSQRKFILASLRALMDINKDSKELMVELVTYYVMAPPPFRAAVKDLIQDVGVQDPHDYFYKELESWPVGEQETKESVRRRSKQWLDGAMQELQEFRRRFLGQEVLAEQKSLSEISLTELRSTESPLWEHMSPEEDEDNFEEQPEWKYSSVSFEEVIFLEKRGAAAGQEGTPPEAEKAFYGHREGAEKEEMRDDLGLEEQQEGRVPARRDQEEPLGDEPVVGKGERPERKCSTKRAQKGTEVTEQRLHLVHPIDAIHHFMEKQLERELEEMKRVVSAALDTPRDTVMVLPPIRKKRAILRLGETNTMWRKRLPERFYFPYIFPRYLMKGFVPFVKLPLPKINLDVFPAPSERPLSPKTFGAMQQSVHRYFIPKFSYADSYP
nr:WD repeat-containing protein 97 isoform X4 [Pogona vitticeps]